ncbi:MAG: response regulator [bacterium]
MVERSLSREGYTVITAASGMEALRALADGLHPDLMITDIVMPGMDGRQLSEKATALQPGLRVLYTSGYTDDALLQRGIRQADVSFLAKPYSLEALSSCVREALLA